MRILFTGGGTGGHFFPTIGVIRELKRLAEDERIIDLELYYMGPRLDDAEKKILETEQVFIIHIFAGKMRRYASSENIFDLLLKVPFGIVQAIWNFFFLIPDVVFSKGGYGAFPAIVASYIFRIPLIIHESDATPGIVNLLARRFAIRIGIAFVGAEEYFPKEKTALVGVPIRKHLLGGNKMTAKEFFDIKSDIPTIGFIGASQGAQKLNDAVIGVLRELTDKFEIVHQTGAKNFDEVRDQSKVILEFSHNERYHPFGFFDENALRQFYCASDIIVSRAGASSIYEIAAWGKPVILLPLTHAAQDHQRKNAYEYAAEGAALVIEESNLTPHILLAEILKIIENPELAKKMSSASQKFARIDAGEIIAREILKIGSH